MTPIDKCKVQGCPATAAVQGYCKLHYQSSWRKSLKGACKVKGCSTKVYSRGLCQYHYFQDRQEKLAKRGEVCKRCGDTAYTKGFCGRCYRIEMKRRKGICVVPWCARLAFRGGVCTDHYREIMAKKEAKT